MKSKLALLLAIVPFVMMSCEYDEGPGGKNVVLLRLVDGQEPLAGVEVCVAYGNEDMTDSTLATNFDACYTSDSEGKILIEDLKDGDYVFRGVYERCTGCGTSTSILGTTITKKENEYKLQFGM